MEKEQSGQANANQSPNPQRMDQTLRPQETEERKVTPVFCIKCDFDLAECVCSDLPERVADLENLPHVFVAPEYMERIKQNARRVAEQQSKAE
mgnify:CR=1 FL=1